MKIKSILTATVSAVMLLTSIGSFPTFADTTNIEDREALLAQLTPEQRDVLEEYWERTGSYDLPSKPVNSSNSDKPFSSSTNWITIEDTTEDTIGDCQGVLDTQPKDYILPYSFEEFLALSDEEFLALEDVPQSAKEYYKQNRRYACNPYVEGVVFQLNNNVEFVETDRSSEAWEKELCEILDIPFEIVQTSCEYYEDSDKPYVIILKDEAYMGYPFEQVQNKAGIYIYFHENVLRSDFRRVCGIPNFVLGDIDCDGEVGVIDLVMLQKWLSGYGNLSNWQSADLHQDGIINIFDLVLLKRMLIQKENLIENACHLAAGFLF